MANNADSNGTQDLDLENPQQPSINQLMDCVEQQQDLAIENIMENVHSKKNRDKWKSALTHFNHFLKNYYDGDLSEVTAVDQINDHLMGTFSTYLAKFATKHCKDGAELISFSSAYGYLSAVKSHFMYKFRDQNLPAVFELDKWKKYMRGVHKVKAAIARENNQVGPKRKHLCILIEIIIIS